MTNLIDPRKFLRFPELYRRDRPLIVCPIDDTLISGPIAGLEDPYTKLRGMVAAEPSAVLTFAGMIERNAEVLVGTRTIVNLSASTTRSAYTHKVSIGSIETALAVHANAVAVHINLSSEHAPGMLEAAGQIIEQARRYGLPAVGIMYPRGERDGKPEEFLDVKRDQPDCYAELVGHCVQVGVDLGFDLIKTQYTGSPETFRRVVALSANVPVVIAGGPLIDESVAIANAVDAVSAGAAGISYARNVFGRADPQDFLNKVKHALGHISS